MIGFDPRNESIDDMVSSLLAWFSKKYLYKRMERTTNRLKEKIEQMYTKNDQVQLLEVIESLEKSLSRAKLVDNHDRKLVRMEEDIVGVRKLIGTTTFGEWKVLLSEIDKINTRIDALSEIRDAYNKVLSQQSSFLKWIKYSTILVPAAVACVPIIETLIRHLLGTS